MELQGKTIVWVSGGDISKRFIFERAKQLGVKSVVIDAEFPNWLACDNLMAKFIQVPKKDDHIDALAALDELRQLDPPVSGCLTFWEPEVYIAAVLATSLGLPCSSPEAVNCARNKHLTRQKMSEAGLPSPKSIVITDEESLEAALQTLNHFPLIFKPAAGYNSFSTYRVNNAEECRQALAEVIELSQDESRFDSLMFKHGIRMLLESYVDGLHVDVDLVLDNDRVAFYAVSMEVEHFADFSFKPMFVTPADIDPNKRRAVIDLAIKACRCLGLRHGAFNIECKYSETNPSPYVIEINARMGGTYLAHTIKGAYNVDLPTQIMLLACGLPSSLKISESELLNYEIPYPLLKYSCGIDVYGQIRTPTMMDDIRTLRSDVLLSLNMLDPNIRNICCADLAGHKVHNGWIIVGTPKEQGMYAAIEAACDAMRQCVKPKPVDIASGKSDPRKLFGHLLEDTTRSRSAALFRELRRLYNAGVEKENLKKEIENYLEREEEIIKTKRPEKSEFPNNCRWFNVKEPLRMDNHLRGKIVLMEYWTYCCVNCMHMFAELKELELKIPHERGFAIIGVHSGKFFAERDNECIRSAILRHGIIHPVINDNELLMLEMATATIYPTFVIFDPYGNKIAHFIDDDVQKGMIELFVEASIEHWGIEKLSHRSLPLRPESDVSTPSLSGLSFPGKLLFSAPWLFISDSRNNRIVILDKNGKFIEQIGTGIRGFKDGSFSEAQLNFPNGLALYNGILYVCDTDNHAVRAIDLGKKQVFTILGTGDRLEDPRINESSLDVGYKYDQENRTKQKVHPKYQKISSPWDICVDENSKQLIIAMAGVHQIWKLDIYDRDKENESSVALYSGTGQEENRNGNELLQCGWAQPSGVYKQNDVIYIADTESSTIRQINMSTHTSATLAGGDSNPTNIWVFGDKEGTGTEARFQHPLHVIWIDALQALCIADSYNHRLKLLHVLNENGELVGKVENWVGGGDAGCTDGVGLNSTFFEPSGLALNSDGTVLYIADSNNHTIRTVEIATKTVKTLPINGVPSALEKDQEQISSTSTLTNNPPADSVSQERHTVKTSIAIPHSLDGKLQIDLNFELPEGFHYTRGANTKYLLIPDTSRSGIQISFDVPIKGRITNSKFTIPLSFSKSNLHSEAYFSVDVLANYCQSSTGLCAIANAVFDFKITAQSVDSVDPVNVVYAFPDPSWRPVFHPIGFRQLGISVPKAK